MNNPIFIPKVITEQLEALNELVERNPTYIPIPELAKFLHVNPSGIQASIENGWCPFGIAWIQDGAVRKAYKVPTATFYLWYVQGCGFRK